MIKQRRSKQASTYRIENKAQLEALALRARAEILLAVGALGPVTVAQIADALGKRRPAVHYQVNILCDLGLLIDAGVLGEGREQQSLYQTPGRNMQLVFDKDDPVVVKLMSDHVKQQLQRAHRSILAGFKSATVRTSGPRRNTLGMQSLCRLDRQGLEQLNHHVDEIGRLCSPDTLAQTGDLYLVTLTLSPDLQTRS